ncbi:unnamed protein product [Trichobilharzia regenti]|nr:unnamed protein product [Trichobilharzia regenti]
MEKLKIEAQNSLNRGRSQTATTTPSPADGNTNNNAENRNEWYISKVFVIVVFSIFAFLVQLVMRFLEPPV